MTRQDGDANVMMSRALKKNVNMDAKLEDAKLEMKSIIFLASG